MLSLEGGKVLPRPPKAPAVVISAHIKSCRKTHDAQIVDTDWQNSIIVQENSRKSVPGRKTSSNVQRLPQTRTIFYDGTITGFDTIQLSGTIVL